MNEKEMTLYRDWQGQPVPGWYCTEKYDGCRAYWDGERLWTRKGNVIAAPSGLTLYLPRGGMHLDCEVWFGRGRFEDARLAVQAGQWGRDARLVVFDVPTAAGDYRDRMEHAKSIPTVIVPDIWYITKRGSVNSVRCRFAHVKGLGGEGLVLRRPGVGYEKGRTSNTLRVKDIICV